MKNMFTILLLFFAYNSIAQNSWKWLNPYPNGDEMIAVSVAPNKDVYVVTGAFKVLFSNNQGTAWKEKIVPKEWQITKYYCKTNLIHFVLCYNGELYKSIDGGNTWKFINTRVKDHLYDIWFINDKIGFINGNKLLMTSDGGENWIHRTSPNTIETCNIPSDTIFDECGTNWPTKGYSSTFSSVKYYINNKRIIKSTNDCTIHDTVYDHSPCFLNNLSFLNEDYGYAVGDAGAILKTTDGGKTWTNMYSTGIHKDLRKIFFVDNNVGYALGYDGVLKTTNKGKTWFDMSNGLDSIWEKNAWNSHPLHISFSTADIGIIASKNLIYRTINGGLNWTKVFEFKNTIEDIGFKNTIGYLCGKDSNFYSSIYKSIDNGLTWTKSYTSPNNSEYFSDLQILGDKLFVLSGIYKKSTIYETTDGITLTKKDSILNSNAKYIQYINSDTAFAFVQTDSLYETTDGGKTWKRKFTYKNGWVEDFYFVDGHTGYFINNGLRKTTDAGETWNLMNTLGANILSFFFLNSTTAYAVGNCGFILQLDSAITESINNTIISNSQLSVYPNPASKQLSIKLSTSNIVTDFDINICNQVGQVIANYSEKNISDNKATINISEYAKGFYFIDVKANNTIYRTRLIKL